jgi:hypothetical protein
MRILQVLDRTAAVQLRKIYFCHKMN